MATDIFGSMIMVQANRRINAVWVGNKVCSQSTRGYAGCGTAVPNQCNGGRAKFKTFVRIPRVKSQELTPRKVKRIASTIT